MGLPLPRVLRVLRVFAIFSNKIPAKFLKLRKSKYFRPRFEIYFGLKNIFNFIQKEPILRPFDPFNREIFTDNPNHYRFDTTYGFTSTQGIKGFAGLRYILQ